MLINLTGIAGVFALACLVMGLIAGFNAKVLGLPFWAYVAISAPLAVWSYRRCSIAPRKGCHVFDRNEGKIYIYVGDDEPHLALDFYDSYFYLERGHHGYISYSGVYLNVPKVERDGKTLGGYRLCMTVAAKRLDEAENAWYMLVRFMDKSWPLSPWDLEWFEEVKAEKEKKGFAVHGIRAADGSQEIV